MVVGADRVVANGDTANKVGTYQLAITAKHHGIPFYVAAPSTSCDLSLESGRDVVIEVRPPEELTSINGVPIAAPGTGLHWFTLVYTGSHWFILVHQRPRYWFRLVQQRPGYFPGVCVCVCVYARCTLTPLLAIFSSCILSLVF